jgi:DMSO/TMAO reductase YedYZ molybdopterin-dependent catalytic subunit
MRFFERVRKELEERGIDPNRLPPGQYVTERFPVLHAGDVPIYDDLSKWTLQVTGLVEHEAVLTYDELLSLGTETITTDIHCVTKWSKFDTLWEGVKLSKLFELVRPSASAKHLIIRAEYGFSTNVPLEDVLSDPNAMLATGYDGKPLEPEHGYPVRFLLPHLYFWKSAKWVRALEFKDHDEPGFWERNGYHNYGDPWQEQRYWGD